MWQIPVEKRTKLIKSLLSAHSHQNFTIKEDYKEIPNFGTYIKTHEKYEGNEEAFKKFDEALENRIEYNESKKGARRENFVCSLDAPGAG